MITQQDIDLVMDYRDRIGRKFAGHDVDSKFVSIAEDFTLQYDGTFDFMLNMQDAFSFYGTLTEGQAAGVLNVLVVEVQRRGWHAGRQGGQARQDRPKPKARPVDFGQEQGRTENGATPPPPPQGNPAADRAAFDAIMAQLDPAVVRMVNRIGVKKPDTLIHVLNTAMDLISGRQSTHDTKGRK